MRRVAMLIAPILVAGALALAPPTAAQPAAQPAARPEAQPAAQVTPLPSPVIGPFVQSSPTPFGGFPTLGPGAPRPLNTPSLATPTLAVRPNLAATATAAAATITAADATATANVAAPQTAVAQTATALAVPTSTPTVAASPTLAPTLPGTATPTLAVTPSPTVPATATPPPATPTTAPTVAPTAVPSPAPDPLRPSRTVLTRAPIAVGDETIPSGAALEIPLGTALEDGAIPAGTVVRLPNGQVITLPAGVSIPAENMTTSVVGPLNAVLPRASLVGEQTFPLGTAIVIPSGTEVLGTVEPNETILLEAGTVVQVEGRTATLVEPLQVTVSAIPVAAPAQLPPTGDAEPVLWPAWLGTLLLLGGWRLLHRA
jgi:hypothetical protein